MSGPGITAINSGPLIIRSYNDITGKNNTYILNQYDYPVSSNYVMITSSNGLLAPTDRPYISSITASSLNASRMQGSSITTIDLTVTGNFIVPVFTALSLTASTFAGSSITTNTITANSSITVSSLNAINSITTSLLFSTIRGSTILANTGIFNSTLFVSSLSSVNQTFSTLKGSSLSTTTAVIDSTLIASTITAINYGFSTLTGSTISAVSTVSRAVNCSTLLTSTVSGITGPTVRRLTAATYSTITTGTYTPAAGVARIRVRMCAGGGGGGGYLMYGYNGTSTIFGSGTSQWIAAPGYGADGSGGPSYYGGNGGNGGSGGTDATAANTTLVIRIPGGKGQGGSLTNSAGSQGGSNTFGGGGAGGGNFSNTPVPPSTPNGWPGIAHTGGGGGGSSAYNASYTSPGGGAGEYVEFYVNAPGPMDYTIGKGGYEGRPVDPIDVCCWFGGYGASGIILIEEFYI